MSFSIKNLTGVVIDSIHIGASGLNYENPKRLVRIGHEELNNINLNLSGIPREDGNYQITIYKENSIKKHPFGYYSNGSPLSNRFELTIETDSILVKEIIID